MKIKTKEIRGFLHLHRGDHHCLLIRHRASYEHDSNLHVNHPEERREIPPNRAVEDL